jgi:hypothetical protein
LRLSVVLDDEGIRTVAYASVYGNWGGGNVVRAAEQLTMAHQIVQQLVGKVLVGSTRFCEALEGLALTVGFEVLR